MQDQSKRSDRLDCLHPEFRARVCLVLGVLEEEGIPFKVFESVRSPERQAKLYAKRPRVTRAKPWRSFHQYGLAADFVLYIDDRWSWSTKTPEHRAWWDELHRVAKSAELAPLSWEKPHLQLDGISMRDLRKGRYPAGDDPWAWALNNAIARYPKGAPPLADYDDEVWRPATKDGLDHEA